jgi:hypothetical protein
MALGSDTSGFSEGWQKLELGDVIDVVAYQSLDLTAVRALQRREAANVKRLQKVG